MLVFRLISGEFRAQVSFRQVGANKFIIKITVLSVRTSFDQWFSVVDILIKGDKSLV